VEWGKEGGKSNVNSDITIVLLLSDAMLTKKNLMYGWRWASVVEWLTSMHQALSLISNTREKKKNQCN
jgi:hypothetical protein